ncbi:unnamed protein product [Phytophthora fragariaefolia]|uniref:Unnamed protein product n=1 Tax=Phytophthora fragariaefolia TaxID=1490495 RepID=A0A9W7CXX7_9STRA|nr:unnamed protein product [Phytophthora fragariaefolia]
MQSSRRLAGYRIALASLMGPFVRSARPTWYQEQAYSGHKKVHCTKFQRITLANGLTVSLVGPFEGRRHDAYMLRKSEMAQKMTRYLSDVIFGDQGYPLRSWLITPFASAASTPLQLRFSRDLSRARIASLLFGSTVCRVVAAETKLASTSGANCRPWLYLADLTTEGPVDDAQYISDEEINFSRTNRIFLAGPEAMKTARVAGAATRATMKPNSKMPATMGALTRAMTKTAIEVTSTTSKAMKRKLVMRTSDIQPYLGKRQVLLTINSE